MHKCVICVGKGKVPQGEIDFHAKRRCHERHVQDCYACSNVDCGDSQNKPCTTCNGSGSIDSGELHFLEIYEDYGSCLVGSKREDVLCCIEAAFSNSDLDYTNEQLEELADKAMLLKQDEILELSDALGYKIKRIEISSQELDVLPEFDGY